jgi:membrane protease YdiL (CAAX protease family)
LASKRINYKRVLLKKIILANPLPGIAIVFAAFFVLPIAASMLPLDQLLRNFLVVALLLLLSFLLYKKQGSNLSQLGIDSRPWNLLQLPIGLLLGIAFFCVLLFFQSRYNGIGISLNPDASYPLILYGLLLALPGVLMEELIFRGYCLQRSVQGIGFARANIFLAFFFVVWHWIAFNAWGNYGLMLSLVTTAFGHLLFAVAITRSKTLFLPIGIHLGNNWASRNLFSFQEMGTAVNTAPSKDSLFRISTSATEFSTLHTVGSYLITFSCFLICTGIVILLYKRKRVDESSHSSERIDE